MRGYASIQRLIWSLLVIVIDEGSEPGGVEAFNPHCQCLNPLSDLVAVDGFEIAAQTGAS